MLEKEPNSQIMLLFNEPESRLQAVSVLNSLNEYFGMFGMAQIQITSNLGQELIISGKADQVSSLISALEKQSILFNISDADTNKLANRNMPELAPEVYKDRQKLLHYMLLKSGVFLSIVASKFGRAAYSE